MKNEKSITKPTELYRISHDFPSWNVLYLSLHLGGMYSKCSHKILFLLCLRCVFININPET